MWRWIAWGLTILAATPLWASPNLPASSSSIVGGGTFVSFSGGPVGSVSVGNESGLETDVVVFGDLNIQLLSSAEHFYACTLVPTGTSPSSCITTVPSEVDFTHGSGCAFAQGIKVSKSAPDNRGLQVLGYFEDVGTGTCAGTQTTCDDDGDCPVEQPCENNVSVDLYCMVNAAAKPIQIVGGELTAWSLRSLDGSQRLTLGSANGCSGTGWGPAGSDLSSSSALIDAQFEKNITVPTGGANVLIGVAIAIHREDTSGAVEYNAQAFIDNVAVGLPTRTDIDVANDMDQAVFWVLAEGVSAGTRSIEVRHAVSDTGKSVKARCVSWIAVPLTTEFGTVYPSVGATALSGTSVEVLAAGIQPGAATALATDAVGSYPSAGYPGGVLLFGSGVFAPSSTQTGGGSRPWSLQMREVHSAGSNTVVGTVFNGWTDGPSSTSYATAGIGRLLAFDNADPPHTFGAYGASGNTLGTEEAVAAGRVSIGGVSLVPVPPPTSTPLPTSTITLTPTITRTPSSTGTHTQTPTPTATGTHTRTATATATGTNTPTQTSTFTITLTPIPTPIPEPIAARGEHGETAWRPQGTGPTSKFSLGCYKGQPGDTEEWYCQGEDDPLHGVLLFNDQPVTEANDMNMLQCGATLECTSPVEGVVLFEQSPDAPEEHTENELNLMGAVTKTLDSTISGVLDFEVPPEVDGIPVSWLAPIRVTCAGFPLDGLTYYCPLAGGPVGDAVANASGTTLAACTPIGAALTVLDTGGALAALPASCAVSVGLAVDEVEADTLYTLPGSTNDGGDSYVGVAALASGEKGAIWLESGGAGCDDSLRTVRVDIPCR